MKRANIRRTIYFQRVSFVTKTWKVNYLCRLSTNQADVSPTLKAKKMLNLFRAYVLNLFRTYAEGDRARGEFLTSPLAPRDEICPLGEMFTPLCSPPGVNTLYCLEEWRGEQRISPPGENFTLHPWGQSFPLRG
jgi:hypothetical protein